MYLFMFAKAEHKLFSISSCSVQRIPYVWFSRMALFTKQMSFSALSMLEHYLYHLRWYKYEVELNFIFKEVSVS